jgi:carbon-monoxide dehydrogenase small subunit
MPVSLRVNGERVTVSVPPRYSLADTLRDELGLTGTHLGCEHGVCGACTVLVDGEAVRACLVFAVQLDDRSIETVESLGGDEGKLNGLQEEMARTGGLQCGFCTPGFLMLATGALAAEPDMDDERLTEVLASNLCRCTGYGSIVEAVQTIRQGHGHAAD